MNKYVMSYQMTHEFYKEKQLFLTFLGIRISLFVYYLRT